MRKLMQKIWSETGYDPSEKEKSRTDLSKLTRASDHLNMFCIFSQFPRFQRKRPCFAAVQFVIEWQAMFLLSQLIISHDVIDPLMPLG